MCLFELFDSIESLERSDSQIETSASLLLQVELEREELCQHTNAHCEIVSTSKQLVEQDRNKKGQRCQRVVHKRKQQMVVR
jgi:hypothetical protein